MTVDEYFKKPGSIPFNWEIRPGVPKTPFHPNHQPPPPPPPPSLSPPPQAPAYHHSRLKPPPSGFQYFSPEKPRSRSFRSGSETHSKRWSLELPQCTAVTVVSSGCFPARRTKESKKWKGQSKLEPNYVSDTDTASFRSVSSRKSSISPFQGSPSSTYSFRSFQSSPAKRSVSSYVSYKPSPQRMSDADWAAFGLF